MKKPLLYFCDEKEKNNLIYLRLQIHFYYEYEFYVQIM